MKNLKTIAVIKETVMFIATTMSVIGFGFTLASHTTNAARTPHSQDASASIYDNASPAVVEIEVTRQGSNPYGPRFLQEGVGCGFLVDNQGHILTNNHVVHRASNVQVVLKSGNTVAAKVVGTDPVDDLALISIDSSSVSGITPLRLGDSSAVKPGQMAIALGSPYSLTDSITIGVISGLNQKLGGSSGNIMMGMLQTDAAINPRNSGGPLLDSQGWVIGIDTAVKSTTGTGGIGFAIPSNVANTILPSLMVGKNI